MSPPTGASQDFLPFAEKQGEIYALVREIKHTANNTAQKVDAIGPLIQRVEDIVRRLEDHDGRLRLLEVAENKRAGAVGLMEWLSRHWPFTIIVGMLTLGWAKTMGKL